MQEEPLKAPAPSSTFITVLAWLFIVASGFFTVVTLMQNIMFHFMMPGDLPPPTSQDSANMPFFLRFMFDNFRLILLASLIVSTGAFIAAIGLLRRRNWARITFVGLLGLGIVWSMGGLLMQHFVFSSMDASAAHASPGFDENFDRMKVFIQMVSAIFSIGFSLLYAWLIKRLCSESIIAEFTP